MKLFNTIGQLNNRQTYSLTHSKSHFCSNFHLQLLSMLFGRPNMSLHSTLPETLYWLLLLEVVCPACSLTLFISTLCSLHCLQTWSVWQGRWLHPWRQGAWVLPEEDQGQERQIDDAQLFDMSIKIKMPPQLSMSVNLGFFLFITKVALFCFAQNLQRFPILREYTLFLPVPRLFSPSDSIIVILVVQF